MLYRGLIHVVETDQKAREEVASTYFQTRTAPDPSPSHSETEEEHGPGEFDIKKALSAEQFQTLGRYYKALIPSCHLVLVYEAAHALSEDRPEAFTEVVSDFL